MHCIKQLSKSKRHGNIFNRGFPYRLRDFSVWPFHSGRFGRSLLGRSRFGPWTFRSWPFRSRDTSVRLWNLAEIWCVHFSMRTNLNEIKILLMKLRFYLRNRKTWSKIQQLISMHMTFSLSSASNWNHYRHFLLNAILQNHNNNSFLIAIMTPNKGIGITPDSVIFRLPA